MQQRWVHSQTGSRRAVSVFIYFRSKGREKEDTTAPPGRSTMGPLKKKSQDQAPLYVRGVPQTENGLTITRLPQAETPNPLSLAGSVPMAAPAADPAEGTWGHRRQVGGPHALKTCWHPCCCSPRGRGRGFLSSWAVPGATGEENGPDCCQSDTAPNFPIFR